MKLRISSSHEEGCERDFAITTKGFSGKDGGLRRCTPPSSTGSRMGRGTGRCRRFGSEFVAADLVLLAMGYVHPVHQGMLKQLGVALDARGNVQANTEEYRTSNPKVFAAGDMRRGQSLVVWAIREGRQAARAVDKFLMGCTDLPS